MKKTMRRWKPVFIYLLVLILFGIILYFSSLSPGQKKNKQKVPQPASVHIPVLEHKGHAAVTELSKPQAKSQSEAAKAQAAVETPTVEIPEDKQQLIGIKKTEVAVRPLQKIIRTVGRVEYDERRVSTVNTKFEGWLEKLYLDYTGKYVKAGEPLAEIYSPELVATQQEFLNALKWGSKIQKPKSKIDALLSKDADMVLEAARQRLRLWDISEDQIKKIEETEKPLRTLTIYSPASGYVVQKMALKGMRVMPGEKLFDIADISTVWVISDIYEYELPLIKAGQTANITLSYFPDREFSAVIDYVYPALAGETRTAKVRFSIPNPKGMLKPQMFTNVGIKIDMGKRLSIPEDAVIDTGVRQIVYVDKGEGNFEPREVRIGLRVEGLREVISGLKAGEIVASSATFLIDSEAQLKGITPLGTHKH